MKFTTVLSDSIDWLKDKIGLGAVITGSALAIGAVSALVGAAALYYVFKPDYDDSKKDLKVSYNLKKLLDSAEPEVAKQIEQDLEKQIDDAYNQGKTDQWFSGIGSMLKYAAIIGGTIYIVPKAISAIQEHNRAA